MAFQNSLVPDLSLERQLSRALDRRNAAHMCRDDLSMLADYLIVETYNQQHVIDALLGRVRQLEVEVVLAQDSRPLQPPGDDHRQWAREVLEGLRRRG